MRILHVIPSVASSDGGPARAVVQMVRALRSEGVSADIVTTDDSGAQSVQDLGVPVDHEGCRTYFFPRQVQFYKVSLPMLHWLDVNAAKYDVVHIHALFSFPPWAAGRASLRAGVPYIVRPLGVLNRYGMEQRRPWLKSLSFALIEKPLLRRAAAIHYTSPAEAEEASRLGLSTRPAVIPLGMDFTNALPRGSEAFMTTYPQARGRPVVLFMSRIDEKKGLPLLLDAFRQVRDRSPDALLVIAGKGDDALEHRLLTQADTLGLSSHVLWTGFLDGPAKQSALAAANVFVLPSQSENFGIALLEAMAAGCACVATPGVALANDAQEVVRISQPDAPALANAIVNLLNNPEQASDLGNAAQLCARERFSSKRTAQQLIDLYSSIQKQP